MSFVIHVYSVGASERREGGGYARLRGEDQVTMFYLKDVESHADEKRSSEARNIFADVGCGSLEMMNRQSHKPRGDGTRSCQYIEHFAFVLCVRRMKVSPSEHQIGLSVFIDGHMNEEDPRVQNE